jgi:hypothetical protein
MNAWVRPELPTASVGSSQAPTDAVDNSAPPATRPVPTYKSGKVVQTTGTTSDRTRRNGQTQIASAGREANYPEVNQQ